MTKNLGRILFYQQYLMGKIIPEYVRQTMYIYYLTILHIYLVNSSYITYKAREDSIIGIYVALAII